MVFASRSDYLKFVIYMSQDETAVIPIRKEFM
jgi:hypothetical protein